ncbi:MAG: AAA family ATPase [Muribaculaceae bacterium]|nr:AAA family ATPase [Muribaculaceae bacterium]
MKSSKKKVTSIQFDDSNSELAAARQLLEETSQSVFLSGKAGTGKSTFLHYLTATTKKKYVVLAPTGIAAVNVGGQTLHSFFKIPLKPLLPEDPDFAVTRLRSRLKYSKQHIKLIRSLELIIIDEISMVRADVIDFIDRVLRVYSGNMRLPFGGKQILFVGDVFQLEPVVTGNDRDILARAYSSFYFFDAFVFKQIDLIPIELTKVYRQTDLRFISLLDNIRAGKPMQQDIDLLNSRYIPGHVSATEVGDFTMTIATRRDMVDAINDRHLNALPAPPVVFAGEIENEFPLNSLPTDLNLELKTGAQVVFVRNDPEHRWVNGTVAVVTTCLPDLIQVITEDGEEFDVERERWVNVKYVFNEKTRQVDEIELGAFVQYPLKPAWALTIHKSQGLTFNKVIIDIGRGAFAGGQTYVALSRCRSLEGIILANPITPRDIYIKTEIARFASRFNNPKLIESAIDNSRADALFKSAAIHFDNKNYSEAFIAYSEGLELRPEVARMPAVKRLIQSKLHQLEKFKRSILDLQRQIEKDKQRFADIASGYVKAAAELGSEGWETEMALSQYDKALNISPSYVPALLGKAQILIRTNQPDDALLLFHEVANSNDALSWEGNIGEGDIAQDQGDDFSAINSYLAAHDKNPNAKKPLRRLIEIYRRLQDFESANIYKRKLSRLK